MNLPLITAIARICAGNWGHDFNEGDLDLDYVEGFDRNNKYYLEAYLAIPALNNEEFKTWFHELRDFNAQEIPGLALGYSQNKKNSITQQLATFIAEYRHDTPLSRTMIPKLAAGIQKIAEAAAKTYIHSKSTDGDCFFLAFMMACCEFNYHMVDWKRVCAGYAELVGADADEWSDPEKRRSIIRKHGKWMEIPDVKPKADNGRKPGLKNSEHYTWYTYVAPTGTTVSRRGGDTKIIKGDVVGLRPATTGDGFRLIMETTGTTIIYTITHAQYRLLIKKLQAK